MDNLHRQRKETLLLSRFKHRINVAIDVTIALPSYYVE